MKNPQGTKLRGRADLLTVPMLSLTVLIPSIDGNIVNIGLPSISAALHTSFASVQWVVLSYLLAVAALIVTVGRIGDLLGKRTIYK